MSVRCIINNSLNCYYWAADYTSILLFYQKFFFLFFFMRCVWSCYFYHNKIQWNSTSVDTLLIWTAIKELYKKRIGSTMIANEVQTIGIHFPTRRHVSGCPSHARILVRSADPLVSSVLPVHTEERAESQKSPILDKRSHFVYRDHIYGHLVCRLDSTKTVDIY